MKNKNKKWLRNYKGFSFLEVMFSVFILVVGITAAITLLGKSLQESLDSRNQTMASFLAQESVELVKNIRDTNWLTSGNTSFTGFPGSSPANCRIDIVSGLDCSGSSKVLNYDSTNLRYAHTGGTATKFLRQVNITNGGGATKIITGMVIWAGSSFPATAACNTANKCVYAQVTLTKWGEN